MLASLAGLAPFAIDTYLPAFPAIGHDIGGSPLELQQSLTCYLVPYALMTLWHGAISDAIGRIAAIRIGLWLFAAASIGCALAQDVYTLWFFRALQGVSGGVGNVVARAMVRDLFHGVAAQRLMAQVQMIFGLAPAVAPVIGGLLLAIHWQAIFVFLAAYALLALGAVHYFLPETLPVEKRVALSFSQALKDYVLVFSDREFLLLSLALGCNFAGFFIYVLASPVFLIHLLGLNQHEFGWMFIPTVCGMVLGSWISRQSAGLLTHFKTLRLAYGWMALVVLANLLICVFLPANAWYNILPVALYNVGMALAMPSLSLAGLERHPKLRGTAASGQAFIQTLLSIVSAGALIPVLWFSPLGLAMGLVLYLLCGWLCIRKTNIWQHCQPI